MITGSHGSLVVVDCQRAVSHRAILWGLVFLLSLCCFAILDLTKRLRQLSKGVESERALVLPAGSAEELTLVQAESGTPTPITEMEPTAAPSPSPTALPAFLGSLVGRLDDIIMVGTGGVERVVTTEDASGAVVIRISYRNSLAVPFRPDVEVAFYGEGLQYLGGLRVSWWHSALSPGQKMETHHRLVIEGKAVRHVAVVKPLDGGSFQSPLSRSLYLDKGTWLFDGKQVTWVVEDAAPIQIVEEVQPLAQQDKVLVPFEELIAEFHRTWDGWQFIGGEVPESGKGSVALSKAEIPESFDLKWVLVEIQDHPERTGWVKSEHIKGQR